MKKLITAVTFLIAFVAVATAQMVDPITWTARLEKINDTEGLVHFDAQIEDGWHLYGLNLPSGGPRPTSINFNPVEGVEIGEITPSRNPIEKVDMVFHLKLSWWNSDVTFSAPYKVTSDSPGAITGTITFQGCNNETCIAPSKEQFTLNVTPAVAEEKNDDVTTETVAEKTKAVAGNDAPEVNLWAPVTYPESADGAIVSVASQPWWYIFAMGFVGGLIALLTPCVWPLIPMTVSFFLKKNDSKAKSIRDAIIYGVSIVVIYLVLGLAITGVFGAGILNELATNALFNLAFFLLLVLFAISFFGAFNIQLPESWRNKVDNQAVSTSGMISIFFMAFTLALVSFSCTGPIIGTLLVEVATSGEMAGPALGMGGFALALALPFTLFAIFPSWLKEMPRSGGWLNSVKVVLGFLELALSLKFLSVADLAYGWGILDREVFVSLWVVIFALLGLYLLGKIRFGHDTPVESLSIPRFFLALTSLSFALYLLPGLWGAPLKGVSAFVPPLYTQDFNLYAGGDFEEFDDYEKGMAYAKKNHRPVLIDFSGYGCVNCRKMEGAVFDTPEVEKAIKENFVLIKLMVDDKKKLDKPETVEENGKTIVLETVGDKWSYLERSKFHGNIQPLYVVLDNDGVALTPSRSYDENVSKFMQWLQSGMTKYSEN
ncbi:MAG: cytochrome c biogenesis protein CcdA [Muribaculaceae bacterium]|nr:cytochrome c biogenesis protein CcdA [Muribaculaceae bacterium]